MVPPLFGRLGLAVLLREGRSAWSAILYRMLSVVEVLITPGEVAIPYPYDALDWIVIGS